MDGQIFTTHGWLPREQVDLRESITFEDETIRWVRIDKHLKSTGEWVGNDLRGDVLKGIDFGAVSAELK